MPTYARRGRTLAAALVTAAALFGSAAHAAQFNPNLIIDDAEMRRFDAMSYDDIRLFLAAKGGLGGVFDVDPDDGLLKGAAQIINDAAHRYQVNPKYILALIQKESSAVETASPDRSQLDWATGYALCDGCNRAADSAQKYKGFAKQVDAGAGWIDWFWKTMQSDSSLRKPGQTYDIGGVPITPSNTATAALYTYTPHLHGNQLLWNILNRWFGDGTTAGDGIRFPDGTLVRNAKTGGVALVQARKLRPILNASILATRFNASQVVDVSKEEFDLMQKLMPGRPVRFPDLSLVRDEKGNTYLLVGNGKRRIVSPQVFAAIGFNPEEVEDVHAEDITDYADGEPITGDSEYPSGELLQNTKTGGVYYAEGNVKKPIIDRAILLANFPGRKLLPASPADLDRLANGDPVRFADGTLVKAANDPTVFVVSGGKLRKIPTEADFNSFGYKFKNVLTASPRAMAMHPVGEPLFADE